jgi:zona occludens toxin
MIEVLEGVPGSGKSYYAVSEKFLAWVRANRKIYVFVEGIFLDKLAAFEGRSVEELRKQIIVWNTVEDVRRGLLDVDPGAAVLIDESQTVFRSKEKVDPELLRWLETHRHRGNDVVMMCQQYGQMTMGVIRLVEVTTKFRRLDRFGLKNRYQAQVRGNPEETEVIRMFTGRYSPKVYSYYASYSQAAIREHARGGSIVKSPTVIVGLLGLVMAAWWFASGSWFSGAAAIAKEKEKLAASKLPPPPPVELVHPAGPVSSAGAAPEVEPVRIQGGIVTDKGRLWVTSDGRILTESDIAAESGGTVIPYRVRGVWRLKGSGVKYGSEGLSVQPIPVVDRPQSSASGFVVPPSVSQVAETVGTAPPDPFMTPDNPLEKPFTLATPSGSSGGRVR